MNGSVRLGVIGCGVIGTIHLRAAAAAPEVTVAAVADQLPGRAQEAAGEFGAERAYVEAEDLIGDPEVDAVVLALHAAGRAQLAVQALAAGKHVLVEKPPALNAAEVQTMLAAQGDRVAACCSSRRRFYDSYDAAEACIASGALGELREVYCRVIEGAQAPTGKEAPPWRASRTLNGGGIAVNWSSYDLDYLLGLTGWRLQPEITLARTWPVAGHLASRVAPGSDGESHYVALVLCADGVALHLERGEFAALRREQAWQVIGTHGSRQRPPGPAPSGWRCSRTSMSASSWIRRRTPRASQAACSGRAPRTRGASTAGRWSTSAARSWAAVHPRPPCVRRWSSSASSTASMHRPTAAQRCPSAAADDSAPRPA